MSRYRSKRITIEAIQYTGANWRAVAVEFLGLNQEFVDGDMHHNIYPSKSYRTMWLSIPRDLKTGGIGDDERWFLEPGSWVVIHSDGRSTEVYTDSEFKRRYERANANRA